MLYWSDERSAKTFNNLYNSALQYAAKHEGSYESFFFVNGIEGSLNTIEEMEDAIASIKEPFAEVKGYKGEYLHDMLQAVETFVSLLKNKDAYTYKESVMRILGLDMNEVSIDRKLRVEKEIDDLLSADGYDQATTCAKVEQWYADNLIQPEDLADTARQYLEILQKLTRKIIDVPEEEGWGKLELVEGVSWAAFSQYIGHYTTNMLMNRESVWKRPTFIDTVSHELYPGHHTWYSTREAGFFKDEVPLEAASLGICSAEDLLFEGMPESGAHFTGIDNPEIEIEGMGRELQHKIMVARKILEYVRIIEINNCYRYHVEHWPKDELIADATRDGWVEPQVAERVFRYYSHPFNGLYYPSYYYGRWIITDAYDRFPADKKSDFFKISYGQPHSTNSFIHKIEEMTGEPFDPIHAAQK